MRAPRRMRRPRASFTRNAPAIVASVAPATYQRYERARKARKGIGVAEAVDGRCTGCNLSMRLQFYQDLKRGDEILACECCQRILYYNPPAATRGPGGRRRPARRNSARAPLPLQWAVAMLLHSITLTNLLSFNETTLDLRPLNVLIGPNASGKSNLVSAISLLKAAPGDLYEVIARGGGVRQWISQRQPAGAKAAIQTEIELSSGPGHPRVFPGVQRTRFGLPYSQ